MWTRGQEPRGHLKLMTPYSNRKQEYGTLLRVHTICANKDLIWLVLNTSLQVPPWVN